jgi:hypothetical protein
MQRDRPNLSDSPANGILSVYYIPGDVNVLDLIGDPKQTRCCPFTATAGADQGISIYDGKSPGEEFQVSNNLWTQNPYWAALPDAELRYT